MGSSCGIQRRYRLRRLLDPYRPQNMGRMQKRCAGVLFQLNSPGECCPAGAARPPPLPPAHLWVVRDDDVPLAGLDANTTAPRDMQQGVWGLEPRVRV